MELGSVKGFKSFLGAQATAPEMGKHHSTMYRVLGPHVLVGINRSDFFSQLRHTLGSSENWQSILQTLTLYIEMPETFQLG